MIVECGETAPELNLPVLFEADLLEESSAERTSAESLPGRKWSLRSALQGGPVLLVFIKRSCPTCRWSMPLVDQLFRNYRNGGASVMVVAQEEAGEVRRLWRELELAVPVLVDSDYAASRSFGISFVPTFVFVNREGRIEKINESFVAKDLNWMNEQLAHARGSEVRPFYTGDQPLPAYRPG